MHQTGKNEYDDNNIIFLLKTTLLKTVEVQTEYLDYFTRIQDHALEMVLIRQKSRAGANPESPAITQPVTNICEVSTPRRTVFAV